MGFDEMIRKMPEVHPCEPPEAAILRAAIAKIPPRETLPSISVSALDLPEIPKRPEDGGPFLVEL